MHSGLERLLGVGRVQWISAPFHARRNDLVIATADGCGIEEIEHWEKLTCASLARLLCVCIDGNEAVIGPEIVPNQAGCYRCWLTRYYNGRTTAFEFAQTASLAGDSAAEAPGLTPLMAGVIGQLTIMKVLGILNSHDSGGSKDWKVYYWNLQTGIGREWRLFPDSGCCRCGDLPYNSPENTLLKVASRPKPYASADRVREIRELQPDVQTLYVGRRAGMVPEINIAWPFTRGAVALVDMPLFDSDRPEPCSGFSDRYSTARVVAVLEALERQAGVRPRSYRPAIYASVASLAELAVDPRSFGVHSDLDYSASSAHLTPYSNRLEMNFVWAYSFRQETAVLVPQQLGFYSGVEKGERTYLVEGSNGCSIGSCPEEAIFHGILEVIERDAFLLTWYAQRKQPQFDVMESRDPEIRHRCRRLVADGFAVVALDITTDFGIPAVWLMARRREATLPYAVCVASAHIYPEKALRKALREMDAILNRYELELRDPNLRTRTFALATDFTKVQTMNDHGLLYCAPESGCHLDFLTGSTERTSLKTMDDFSLPLRSADLGEELRRVVDRILQSGSDVVAVNQTTPEQSRLGLHTYKSLVSGAVPINWGHGFRRLEGIHRLDNALRESRLSKPNPAPHPFS